MAYNGYKSSRVPLKTLKAVKDKKFPSMFRLAFETGGPIAENLSGMYGSMKEAQKAIDDWVIGYNRNKITPTAPKNDIPQRLVKKPKVNKDGEAESIS